MGTTVDSLDIQLQMQSQRAVTSIDTLISRLGTLNASLTKINGSGLTGVANGVNKLSNAMQGLKGVGAVDYTRLATGIEKISKLDSKQIASAATALKGLGKGLESLKSVSVSGTAKQVAELASGISKLGYKSSTKAIDNIPKLADAMRDLMSSLSKAPRVSQNLIDMTNALAKLARTGASSGKAATSLSRSLNTYTKATGKASSGTKGLASALGKMYASYWLLFRAFQKIGQSITLASDLVEVQNVVNTVFGDMTAKVEQYADKSIEQFGMSELAFKQYASRFQAMGSAMGIDSGLIGQANSFLNKSTNGYVALSDSMADVSLTLTQLTADMASFYNVEQSAVAEDLAAIFTGETRPLRTYGLDLTQATLSEWAMKQGLDANIQSMSQAEKTMLRYQYVLANTTAAQGDFARTANTWANQLRILQEQIKKWASVVGTGFIAAFKPFLQTLNTVMARVIDFTENVLNALGNIFGWKFEITGGGITDDLADSMGDTAIDTGDAAGSAGDLSDNLGDAAKNAKKLYSTVLGIDELNINNPNTGSSGSGSGGSGGTGGSGSGGAGAGTGTGLTTTMTRNDAILKAYESSIDSLYELGEYIGDTLTKTLNSIDWNSVYQGARNFGKGLADFLNGLISPELFGAVGRTIAGALNTAIYAALSFGETFDFYDFGVSIATGINEFFNTFDFASFAQTLNVWVDGIIETITAAIKNIKWGDVWERIKDFFGNLELDTAIVLSVAIAPVALTGITKIVDSISVMGEVLSPILGLISPLEGIFGSGGLFATASAPILALIGVVTLLAAGLGYVFATNEQVRTSFQSAISTIGENFTPILQYITETIIPDLKTGWEEFVNILTPFGEFLESVFVSIWQDMLNPALSYMGETVLPKLLEVFKNLWENVLVPVGNFIGSVLSPVIEILSSVLSFLWNNVIVPLAKAIGNSLGKAFEGACDILNDRVIPIVNGVIDVFQFLWNKVFSPLITFLWGTFQPVFKRVFDAIEGIINGLSQSFGGLIDFITGVFSGNWEKAWNGIKDIFGGVFNGILSIVGTVVNGIIDGVNWVADKIGIGKLLDNWEVPKFAKGTSGIPQDTLGVVNDQPGAVYKELIVPPSGKPFIPEGRNVMLPLEKGTKIMPAKQTKAFMSGMPHFAGGIGDFFGDLWSGIKEFAGNVWDYISNPGELVKIALDKFISMSNFFEPWTSIAGGIINKMFDSISDFVKGLFDKATPEVSYNPSAGVEQWRALATKALQMTGQFSDSNLNLLLMQMDSESSGNPNAINNWDINAQRGTPSKGLMQVIDPTFKTWAMDGYDTNIWDPLSNMLAAIRYTVNRYGSLANGWKGHGYASGIGKINLSDLIPAYEVGGFPEDGLFFANHNELVGQFDNGRTVVANNTNIQSGIKEGVKEAVAEILAPYLQQIADNTRETADKDFTVDVDGRSLVSAYDRRKSRNGFSFT